MKSTQHFLLSSSLWLFAAMPSMAQAEAAPQWRLPLKAAGAAAQRQLWGYMGSAREWPTASGGYGYMSFTADSHPTFADLLSDGEHTMSPNGGGALHDGRYDAVNYTQSGTTLKVTHYQFNTDNNWRSTIVPTTISDPSLIATETASSRATGKVYGQFYNSVLTGFEFGVIDYDAMERTTIAESKNKYVALGVTSYEVVYGVATDGNLYRIDTETGEERLIGPTGVDVAENSRQSYSQSGEIDQDNDVFYWASIDKDQHAALYTVDLSSGAATLIADMPHNEQILGMAIPDATPADAAPAAVTDFSVNFSGGAVSGTAEFTVPAKTYSGAALSGTVSYTVKANQRTVASGTATPGQRVSVPINVNEGTTYFRLALSNAAGDAPIARLTRYVGFDEPLPPTSARLSVAANGTATVTWGAPQRGVNDGYVGKLTYDVVRNPGNITVAKGIDALSYTEKLPDQLGNYTYSITAVGESKRSQAATTNAVRHGSSIEPTYTETFGTQEDFNLYQTINANNDNYTWKWHDVLQCAQYETNPGAAADDWLVSPPIHLQSDHVYTLSFKARNSLVYYNETIEAKWGTGNTVSALTQPIIGEATLSGAEFQTFGKEITSDKDQTIYLGVHALSQAATAKILVDDISIVDEGHLQGPDAVQHLTITPDAKASLKAKVAFTAPTKNVQGNAVGAMTKIEVARDGVVVHTFSNVSAGQSLSWEDNAPQAGMNRYTVTGYTQQGNGRSASQEAWIGLDQPSAPQHVTATDTEQGVRLAWAASSEKGIHSGVVLPQDLTYNVYSYEPDDLLEPWQPIVEEQKDTHYDLSLAATGAQSLHRYAISARNAAGDGDRSFAPAVISGAPYVLPFRSGFKPGVDPSLWWTPLTKEGSNEFVRNGQQASDGDGHCMMFTSYNAETAAQLYSGKIALEGTQNAEVVFSHNATAGSKDRIEVTVRQPGADDEVIGTVDYQSISGSGWQRSSFKIPAKYAAAPYVVVGFRATAPLYHAIRIDDVCVRGVLANDLSLSLTAPASAAKGLPVEVSMVVENRGTKEASAYSVQLTAGDEVLYSEDFAQPLKPLATHAIRTSVVLPVAVPGGEQTLTATVTYAADEDNANNTAAQQLQLTDSPVPAPLNVAGSQQGDAVSLSWSAPQPASIPTKETFDEYAAWTIDRIGPWTTYSSNKGATGWMWGAMGMPFEHEGEPYVYIVFVPDSIQDGITTYNHTLKPHSGDRCLMSRYSRDKNNNLIDCDDWLFSPMLSGAAQTISFYANDTESDAMNPRYSVAFEVLYSKTGTKPEDFTLANAFSQESGRWGFFEFEVPEGTQYFAIRNVSTGEQIDAFLIDDVSYNAGYGLLEGFNVYRDNELVESLPADATSYSEPQMPWGRHQYAVTAVFAGGESALATGSDLIFTGITAVGVGQTAADSQPVYSLSGQRVGVRSDLKHLPKGVYVSGGKKVVVK